MMICSNNGSSCCCTVKGLVQDCQVRYPACCWAPWGSDIGQIWLLVALRATGLQAPTILGLYGIGSVLSNLSFLKICSGITILYIYYITMIIDIQSVYMIIYIYTYMYVYVIIIVHWDMICHCFICVDPFLAKERTLRPASLGRGKSTPRA